MINRKQCHSDRAEQAAAAVAAPIATNLLAEAGKKGQTLTVEFVLERAGIMCQLHAMNATERDLTQRIRTLPALNVMEG